MLYPREETIDDSDSSARRHVCGIRRHHGAGNVRVTACAICYVISFLLCLREMKPRTKIILTWFYIIICAGVTGSLLARYNYSNEITVAPTDMRKLEISTTFCESVTVKSSTAITTFKFYSEPKIGDGISEVYRKVSTSLHWNDYQYWGYYLLKGSVITAYVCGEVYVYKIVGKNNLLKWLKGSHEDSNDGGILLSKICGSGMYNSAILNETASKSDEYYFLFLNKVSTHKPLVNFKVDFRIRRKYYHLQRNISSLVCDATECTVPLAAQSSEWVVIYVPDNLRTRAGDISVTSICKARVYMYVLVFGILPLLIGILITCAIVKCSRKRHTNSDRDSSSVFTVTNNELDRLHGFTNANFQLQMSPPSYEEVQALGTPCYGDKAPPSYEEVVRNSGGELSATGSD